MKAKCGKYGHIWKNVCISNHQNLLKPARIADCIENLRCGFLFVWNSFSIRAGTFPRVETSQKSFAMEFKSATGIQLPAWLFCDHFAAASPKRKVFDMMSDIGRISKHHYPNICNFIFSNSELLTITCIHIYIYYMDWCFFATRTANFNGLHRFTSLTPALDLQNRRWLHFHPIWKVERHGLGREIILPRSYNKQWWKMVIYRW